MQGALQLLHKMHTLRRRCPWKSGHLTALPASQEIYRSPVSFLLVVTIPPSSPLHKSLPVSKTDSTRLDTDTSLTKHHLPRVPRNHSTHSQHCSLEEHQWKWFVPLLNNTARALLTEAQGPIFGYENTVKVHWFNFILKWEHMENGAPGNNAILLNRCSCQRKHLEGKQVWLMRWFTTVNLGHNSNTISISFRAIPRRKKSNYITVTESQEGRRANTLILCPYRNHTVCWNNT